MPKVEEEDQVDMVTKSIRLPVQMLGYCNWRGKREGRKLSELLREYIARDMREHPDWPGIGE